MADLLHKWRVAGINFDHMHMGDLLKLVHQHPNAEIVGVADSNAARMRAVADKLSIPGERQFLNFRECLESTRPDIVILCPKTAEHADYVEWVAPYGVHLLVEKPMASTLQHADRMIAAAAAAGKTMVINWPLAWYPPHVTTQRLIAEGVIGDLLEVHYYDGNRGPLRHSADKVEISATEAAKWKAGSWWYQRESGGGSLLDYLGYGVTLGTWFHAGKAPLEVTTVVDETPGLEVDEHSITIAKYDCGLSKYETRWGTFTDPWTHQPQPKCGFVVVGTAGTISSYDYEAHVHIQTEQYPERREIPVDTPAFPRTNPIEYLIHCLESGEPITGPLSLDMCRTGQQIVDTAVASAAARATLPLVR